MNDLKNDVQMSLKLPRTLYEGLLKRADLLKWKKSKVFRKALETYLRNETTTLLPESFTIQVHFLAQIIRNVDSLDAHKDLIRQQVEVLECLITEEHNSRFLNG